MKININKKTIMKIMIKIISILMLTIQMLTLGANYNISNAEIKNGDTIMLKGDHECDSLVEFYLASANRMSYKIVWYVYYEDGQRYPAFCVEPAKEGVGTGYTEYEGSITKEDDNCIWRILQKGYMGSKWTDWDLECDDDFYSANKIALHSYAEKIAPKDKYVLGTRSVDGNTVEEIQRRAKKVLDIAQQLYEYGINGTEIYTAPQVSIQKVGNYKIETIKKDNEEKKQEVKESKENQLNQENEEIQNIEEIQSVEEQEYYIQEYRVNSNKYLKSYDIDIKNFTLNTKILDSNNKEITNRNEMNNKEFKIAIPIDEIKDTIRGQIIIKNAEIKTNPVFYAKSSIPKAQSYVTYTSGFEKTETSEELEIDPKNCSIKILKIDGNSNKKLDKIEFEIKTENDESIGKYITDKNGEIQINNLLPGKYKIRETKTREEYVINDADINVGLVWGKTEKVEVKNYIKKGSVEIIKTDAENKEKRLAGVEFELLNENNEKIGIYTTDEKGEIRIDELEYGTYRIKEIKTNDAYILDEAEHVFEIRNNNEFVMLEITNKAKPKLPRTGF